MLKASMGCRTSQNVYVHVYLFKDGGNKEHSQVLLVLKLCLGIIFFS